MAAIPDDPQWTAHLRGVGMFLGFALLLIGLHVLPKEAHGSAVTGYLIFAGGDVGQRLTSKKDEKKPLTAEKPPP